LGTGKVAQRLTGKVEARQVLKICRRRCQCTSVRVYATSLGATSPAATSPAAAAATTASKTNEANGLLGWNCLIADGDSI